MRNYNPYSNTYNARWRDHPNLSYGNQQVNQPNFQQYRQPCPPRQQQDQTSSSGMSLEDIVKFLTTNTLQFQQKTKQFQQEARASIKSLDNQMGQMATAINRLEAQGSGKSPFQTMVVPISLEQEKEKDVLEEKSVPNDDGVPKRKFPPLSEFKPTLPFPQALVEPRKDEHNRELYETFSKCEVNIPFLDAIKQVPRYAKFLKKLCTLKRKQKLKRCEKINVGKNVSAIIQRNLPTKCKDPGMFSIPCTIGNIRFEKAMLDSGASINVMPYFLRMFSSNLMIWFFSANFYVLDMEYNDQTIPILPGRPFLRTSKAKIDFYSGMLTMKFDDRISEFNIYDVMKHPDEIDLVYYIQVMDNLEQEVLELDENNAVKVAIDKHIEDVNQELPRILPCRKSLQH
ncbi:uncharacterized protein LOC111411421 [Olea europaea var. sylvestris]|uniref:uncharacterized protein LOC111411421 n=1 Tax=Olea europaea var. sylvestris TaxID=158386 RepID=UPI000C1D120C|nr:uncharacterized protein LOC111411421 [Olea europaea var. sylvestris]